MVQLLPKYHSLLELNVFRLLFHCFLGENEDEKSYENEFMIRIFVKHCWLEGFLTTILRTHLREMGFCSSGLRFSCIKLMCLDLKMVRFHISLRIELRLRSISLLVVRCIFYLLSFQVQHSMGTHKRFLTVKKYH